MKFQFDYIDRTGLLTWNLTFSSGNQVYTMKNIKLQYDSKQPEKVTLEMGEIYDEIEETEIEFDEFTMHRFAKDVLHNHQILEQIIEESGIFDPEADLNDMCIDIAEDIYLEEDIWESFSPDIQKSLNRSIQNLTKQFFKQQGWDLEEYENEEELIFSLSHFWFQRSYEDDYTWTKVEDARYSTIWFEMEVDTRLLEQCKKLFEEKGLEWSLESMNIDEESEDDVAAI